MKTKTRSKILAFVLSVMMVITFTPSFAFAGIAEGPDDPNAVVSLTHDGVTTYYDSFGTGDPADPGALDAAVDGDTVKLLANINLTGNYDAYRAINIDKSITVDGNNKTITIGSQAPRGIAVGAGLSSDISVKFKDLTIVNSTNGARCIDTRGNIGQLDLENV
ncbi:MAG: hypothetical protein IKE35_07170, partial [Lachnospiraceae bacterium]|nr:hypothetical protein [Lachnospiraceae bacterium]